MKCPVCGNEIVPPTTTTCRDCFLQWLSGFVPGDVDMLREAERLADERSDP